MAGGKELIGMVSKHAVQSMTNTMDIQAETSLEYIKLGIVQQQTRITELEAEALAAQEQFTIMQSDLKKAVQQGLCDKPKAMGGEKWGTPKEPTVRSGRIAANTLSSTLKALHTISRITPIPMTPAEDGRRYQEYIQVSSDTDTRLTIQKTVIEYELPQSGEIQLVVCDVTGQRVARLASGPRQAGIYALRRDGRNDAGRQMASGVYLYRLEAASETGDRLVQTRKLLLLR